MFFLLKPPLYCSPANWWLLPAPLRLQTFPILRPFLLLKVSFQATVLHGTGFPVYFPPYFLTNLVAFTASFAASEYPKLSIVSNALPDKHASSLNILNWADNTVAIAFTQLVNAAFQSWNSVLLPLNVGMRTVSKFPTPLSPFLLVNLVLELSKLTEWTRVLTGKVFREK